MGQSGGEALEPKGRKAKVTKSLKSQDGKGKVNGKVKIKISIYVSLEALRRLGIHATMTGQDKSAVVDSLIREHLRDWVVQYRPSTRGPEEPGPDSEVPAV